MITRKIYDNPMYAAALNFTVVWAVYLGMDGLLSLIDRTPFQESAFQPFWVLMVGVCSLFYAAVGYFRAKKDEMNG